MSITEIDIKPEVQMCAFCQKRRATKLCDFPIGHIRYVGHPPRYLMDKAHRADVAFTAGVEMERTLTCDAMICEDCATRITGDIDFCPSCVKRTKEATR